MLLKDCDGFQARQLQARLAGTECLQELWHLRPTLYQCIALRHGEREAIQRLQRLEDLVEEAIAA